MASIIARKGKGGIHYRALIRKLGVTQCATFPTKAQAQAWATVREAEILAGARGLPTKHTVADAIDEFINRVIDRRKGARWERIRLEKFKRDSPRLCAKPLGKLTSDDMAKWRDHRLGEVSGSSVAREMNLWGALFSIAASEWRWVSSSPIKGVRRPTEPAARRRGITEAEIEAICASLGAGPVNAEVKDAFLLSLETAMRAGEILGLTWDHVDLVNRVVTLPVTKNGDSRQVPLSTLALNILKERLEHYDASIKELAGVRVFTTSGASLDALFRRARDAAVKDCPSVASCRFHDARSAAITRLAGLRNVDGSLALSIYELARIVGHRRLDSLLFYYHSSAAEIAKKLD